jgi:hypothetical protein
MPTHLFCLIPAGNSIAPPPPARAVDLGVATAWVGDVEADSLSRDARDAARATIEHDRVIGAAMTQGVTPIPASLADPYATDAEMQADVLAHAGELEPAFLAVAGLVEMTTIIGMHDVSPPVDSPGRGRAYLEQLRSLPERAAAIGDRIERRMSSRFADARRRGEGGRVALSHLVPPSGVEDYRHMARANAGEGYRVAVDGPRAPYSFAMFSPRRGLLTDMWLGKSTLSVLRHDSSDLGHDGFP